MLSVTFLMTILPDVSLGKIVDLLFKRETVSPTGKAKWTRAVADKLLTNKKYLLKNINFFDMIYTYLLKAGAGDGLLY